MSCRHFTSQRRVSLIVFLCVLFLSHAVFAQSGPRRIVQFKKGVNKTSNQKAKVIKAGGSWIKGLGIINGAAVNLPDPAKKALLKDADVLLIEDDALVFASKPDRPGKPPKDDEQPPTPQPEEELPWGVDRIDAEYTHLYFRGRGINVAVLDTGIDSTHPDLAANCKAGVNIINTRKAPADDNGHGTHVAGTIAAEAYNVENNIGVIGVAPEATLVPVKVLDRRGSGWVSDIIAGINWCVENDDIDIHVVNMSLGGSSYLEAYESACDNAVSNGLILVAAAGNHYPGGSTAVSYPAAYGSVIAVSATTIDDTLASFSNDGPEVDIAAPGEGIRSTVPGGGYEAWDGTSMACPHVAGTVALILSSEGTLADLFVYGKEDLDSIAFGAGLVDAGFGSGDDLP